MMDAVSGASARSGCASASQAVSSATSRPGNSVIVGRLPLAGAVPVAYRVVGLRPVDSVSSLAVRVTPCAGDVAIPVKGATPMASKLGNITFYADDPQRLARF